MKQKRMSWKRLFGECKDNRGNRERRSREQQHAYQEARGQMGVMRVPCGGGYRIVRKSIDGNNENK